MFKFVPKDSENVYDQDLYEYLYVYNFLNDSISNPEYVILNRRLIS